MIFLNGKNKRKGMERSPDTGAGEDHYHIEPGTPRTEAHQQLHRSAHELAEGCAARAGSKSEDNTRRTIPRGPANQQRPCRRPSLSSRAPSLAVAQLAEPSVGARTAQCGSSRGGVACRVCSARACGRAARDLASAAAPSQPVHAAPARSRRVSVSTMDGLLAGHGYMSPQATIATSMA